MEFIDVKTQYRKYKEEIDAAIHTVLDHGFFIMGPEVKQLEAQLAAYTGVKHCISAASGTDTLMMALMAYGIGPGDEVITVPWTWISTVEVVALVGAKPVFVDIDPKTFNIDLDQVEAAITPRTKAIIPVSLYGQMPDMDRLNAIAKKHGIPVIEDGAQSFGATQRGKRSCGVTDVASTSFYPAKTLGCYGDGGALFTNDDEFAAKLRAIRVHGCGEIRNHHTYIGITGRCDTIQAAILLVKLKYFDEELTARERVAARYSKALREACVVPEIAEGNTHVYHQYTIRVSDRDGLAKFLAQHDIPTAIHYPKCVHHQPCFAYLNHGVGAFPVAEQAAHEVISLPMHPWLSEADQDKVCEKICEFAALPVA
ncbi:MAG: DegT/DnrJ/EryC1/StrS family aminotransferase [Chlamydiales bacterium]|nr:DegT/DnrJ/EryC1/StrS family aminotransferase [Chlamydiales bacterium]